MTLPVSDSTKLELGYSYTDAILTSSFERGIVPDLIGVSGERLPGVSKQQATAAVEYSVPINDSREFHARLDASYRSDFWTALPQFADGNRSARVHTGECARWVRDSARPGESMRS